jgi:hypothetical protein
MSACISVRSIGLEHIISLAACQNGRRMHKVEAKKCGRSPTTVSGILPATDENGDACEMDGFFLDNGKINPRP